MSIEAGRIMLNRITELVSQNETFAFETTLSTKSFKNRILDAKDKNYNITLLFFWLKNPELAKERVKTRVLEGGHNIPKDILKGDIIKELKTYLKYIYPSLIML